MRQNLTCKIYNEQNCLGRYRDNMARIKDIAVYRMDDDIPDTILSNLDDLLQLKYPRVIQKRFLRR